MKRWQPSILRFAIGYCAVCAALYFQQQRLMFFPFRQLENTPALYDLPYEEVWIPVPTKTGTEKMHGWWIPANEPDAPVMLYFHHNAANIGANVSQALQFHKIGFSIFIFDYRGFGQSEGTFPTEAQVYVDARAAWTYLTEERGTLPEDIVIYGHSVGGAIAIDLASQTPDAAGLIVQSSFTSMRDVTKRLGVYWLVPVELLLTQRFESVEKIAAAKMPTLILTGTKDIQISENMGKRLCEAAPDCKELAIIEGGGHDNHLSEPHLKIVKQFTEQL